MIDSKRSQSVWFRGILSIALLWTVQLINKIYGWGKAGFQIYHIWYTLLQEKKFMAKMKEFQVPENWRLQLKKLFSSALWIYLLHATTPQKT